MDTTSPFVRLHPDDDVLIARRNSPAGTEVKDIAGPLSLVGAIRFGHKIATRPIAAGEPVRKFGQVIGFTTQAVTPGEWVHTHNLGMGTLSQSYEFATDVPAEPAAITDRTFQGYRRADGRVGTRNYVAIVSTVNCSATAAKYVCLLYTSPSPRDQRGSRMPSSA